ncbi:class I SAM-dependent methyltransferase [Actinoplanes sp. NBC_00393]|uniref:O-methyltransferase n=1 Tax=Actinoplanes sp. NBC_00393 TaxID=2975953 RepID=UPI002E22FDE1
MDDALRTLLDDLYAEGLTADAVEPDRLRRRRNLEPDAAALLTLIMRMAGVRVVVEIGTGNGYSAIWLADAVRDTGGHLTSVDVASPASAVVNLARAGLGGLVTFEVGDGGGYLERLPDGSVDLLFLDAERVQYAGWWPAPRRVIRAGGILAVDNVLSHPDEVAPFLALTGADPALTGTTVAVGKGLHLAWRRPEPG